MNTKPVEGGLASQARSLGLARALVLLPRRLLAGCRAVLRPHAATAELHLQQRLADSRHVSAPGPASQWLQI